MKVVIFARLPIAGAPYQQYRCLQKYTPLDVRFVQVSTKYTDGRTFPKDVLLREPESPQLVRSADVVHIHNYLPAALRSLLDRRRQRIIATFHSVPRLGNWRELMQFAHVNYCIRQPMQMHEYIGLQSLPNLFDIWDYQSVLKVYTEKIILVYCPTNRLLSHVPGSKGYVEVMAVLKQLQTDYQDHIDVMSHSTLPYAENLERKRLGHITIDDVIGHTFHLTSLEACSTSQVVLTSVPQDGNYPFLYTTARSLYDNVAYLLAHREELQARALASRVWVEQNWNPMLMVSEYLTAYEG